MADEKYLDAQYINSFPSSKRASINKLMTENSVTRLINRLVDVDGFIITTGLDTTEHHVDFTHDLLKDVWANAQSNFEFVIRGYYFSIAKGDYDSGLENLLQTTGFVNFSEHVEHVLSAVIFIDMSDPKFPELWGQDSEDSQYKAVQFYIDLDEDPTPPDGLTEYQCYKFPLVRYKSQENDEWGTYVTLDSLFKFSSRSLSNIDGGEISL